MHLPGLCLWPPLLLVLLLSRIEGSSPADFPPASLKLPTNVTDETLISTLRNKVLLFIGDSLTRYQYINLAVFLERRRWPSSYEEDEILPGSVCVYKKYTSFNEYFYYSNHALNGNEMCDCFRTKRWNIENRRYYNPDFNVSLVFIFFGRDLPKLRAEFGAFPFKRVCRPEEPISDPLHRINKKNIYGNDFNDLKQCTGRMVEEAQDISPRDHGSVLYNATQMFRPDVALVNWGHHSSYEIQNLKGKWVYDTMKYYIKLLNVELRNHTRFIWKSTTPSCPHKNRYDPKMGQCNITRQVKSSNKKKKRPKLVGNVLVNNRFMEEFDSHKHVTTLYDSIQNKKSHFPASSNETIENVMPVFTDDIHLHCWVNTQLNKALVAQLFMNMAVD